MAASTLTATCPSCGGPKGPTSKQCRSCHGKALAASSPNATKRQERPSPSFDDEDELDAEEMQIRIDAGEDIIEEWDDVDASDLPEARRQPRARHKHPGKTKMFFSVPGQGYWPRYIPARSAVNARRDGALLRCPECHSRECEGPISCPGREAPLAVVRCPVCRKRIPDLELIGRPADREDDTEILPGEMEVPYGQPNPQDRLKTRLDMHLAVFHKQTALSYGIDVERVTSLLEV